MTEPPPEGAVCPKCGNPITKMEPNPDDPLEWIYYCAVCDKWWFHMVEFENEGERRCGKFTHVTVAVKEMRFDEKSDSTPYHITVEVDGELEYEGDLCEDCYTTFCSFLKHVKEFDKLADKLWEKENEEEKE